MIIIKAEIQNLKTIRVDDIWSRDIRELRQEDELKGWYSIGIEIKDVSSIRIIVGDQKVEQSIGSRGKSSVINRVFSMMRGKKRRYYHFQMRELFLLDMQVQGLLHKHQRLIRL